jgi:hypothetical protein
MASIEIIHQGVPPTWNLKGFFSSNETTAGKTWRSVIGKEASIHFLVDHNSVYQIWYQYFAVVKPLKVAVSLDGVQIDRHDHSVITLDYGYAIKQLAPGIHILKFNFDRVRMASPGQDQRPIPVAFTELRFAPRPIPIGLWGSSSLGLWAAGLLGLGLLVLCYVFLLGCLRHSNHHPK